jgi:hypothetical protein
VLLKESSIVSWASIVTFDYRCIIALQDASQATTTLANGKLVYVFEANHARSNSKKTMPKTYNSGYSLVVTHLTTNPPVRCLNRAERTGSLVFNVLWSYVEYCWTTYNIFLRCVAKYEQSPRSGGQRMELLPFLVRAEVKARCASRSSPHF